jgi:hypothetical protein
LKTEQSALGSQDSAKSVGSVGDPLPTGHLEGENQAEIGRGWTAEKRRKRLRPLGRPFGRIGVWCLFATKCLWGVGVWLKDVGRGSQEIAKIAGIDNIDD